VRPSRFLFFLMVLICGGNGVFAETRVPQSQGEITLSFAPLVKSAAPAVVNIYAKRIVETQTHRFTTIRFSVIFSVILVRPVHRWKIRLARA